MAQRSLLHRSHLEDFKKWLGKECLPVKGEYEVLRWKGSAGKPMRIIFDRTINMNVCSGQSEHLTVNDSAYHDVMAFIKFYKNTKKEKINVKL